MGDLNDKFRERLDLALKAMKARIGVCLQEARERGDIAGLVDPEEIADFIMCSWQGALLGMKVGRDTKYWFLVDRMIFGEMLAVKNGKANPHPKAIPRLRKGDDF